VIAIAAVSFFLGSIVKAGVNRFGPAYAKAKVELADAQISLFTGSGTITGFLVGNPPGWQSDKAIYLGQAHLSMQPLVAPARPHRQSMISSSTGRNSFTIQISRQQPERPAEKHPDVGRGSKECGRAHKAQVRSFRKDRGEAVPAPERQGDHSAPARTP